MYDNEDRPFLLHRLADVGGVSGTGLVAHGTRHADGSATVWWFGKHPTETRHRSMESVIAIHCHGGKTLLQWCSLENNQWTIPWGSHGEAFVWVRSPMPFHDAGWLWLMGPKSKREWNPSTGLPFNPNLADGDHLFAVEGPQGEQCLTDGAAADRLTLLQLLASSKKIWVSRCLAETGGGPAAVTIRTRPS